MAGFYSFGRLKIVSRNGASSAVAAAAYQSGTDITNQYDGVEHNYSGKKDVGETYIRMPESVPVEWRDENVPVKERVGKIWNDIEQIHPAENARLARKNFIALPHNLTLDQGLECVDEFIKKNCTDKGMGAVYTLHNMPGNRHVDVMYLIAEYDKSGKPKTRSKKEYLCRDKFGNESYMDAEALKKSEGYEKVYKYSNGSEKANMTASEASERGSEWTRVNKYPVDRKIIISGWDQENLPDQWRKSWEEILNKKYSELGISDRVDCRSHAERGLSTLPTVHEGWNADRKEKEIHNQEIRRFNQELSGLYRTGNAAIKSIEEQIEDLEKNPQTLDSINAHEKQYDVNERILWSIIQSDLFSQAIKDKFKANLVRLDEQFQTWLDLYRDNLEKAQKRNMELSEASERTREASGSVKTALNDMISDAASRKKQLTDEEMIVLVIKKIKKDKKYQHLYRPSLMYNDEGHRRSVAEQLLILATIIATGEVPEFIKNDRYKKFEAKEIERSRKELSNFLNEKDIKR